MRTITKSLVTFLLLFVAGSMSAQSLKVILERDYSTTDSYPYYWMGDKDGDAAKQPFFCNGTAVVEITDGALRIANNEVQANNYDLQPFVLDWFNTTEGEDYVIRVWLKAEMDGSANLSIGTWGTSGNATLEFKQSDDYVMYSVNHTAAVTSTGNDEHILWQMGSTVGTVYIQKIQILQMGEDKPVLSSWGTWKPLINNSDMEGDDVSSFFAKIDRDGTDPVPNAVISDGVGVDGSRGIMVAATEKVEQAWDNQFWFRFNEPLEANTQYRVKFDYKADLSGDVATQAHAAPGDYIHYELLGNISFTGDWQTYEKNDLKVTSSQAKNGNGNKFQSVAFNLNDIADANNYYFDNIYVDAYEPQIDVQYGENGSIKILFPYYVNTCRLMVQHAGGKRRLILPNEMFKVTVNGKEAEFESIEIDVTGAILVFISEDWAADNGCEYLSEDDEIVVTFNNLEGDYNIFNIDTNEKVEAFTQNGRFNEELDELPFTYGAPEMMTSDPEEGSFNLPSTISEFKLTFDKKVIVNKIEAKLDNETLKAEAEEEFSTAITLKRTSDKALADGEHKITVTQIFAEQNLGSNDYSSCEVNFSTGVKVSQDLLDAIAAAKTVLDNTNDARYAGTAYTNLDAAITKYTAEAPSYTAPSVIDAAMLDLSNLSKALTAHKTLVDNYDASNQKAQDLVAELAESKYNKTDLFLQLKEVAEKYAGKQLTDDEELQAGYDELKPIADLCGDFFSEGPSTCGMAGMAVVTDRIREGVEALMALGWTEDDPLIVEANNAMSDDDIIANKIKEALTLKIYEELKSDNPTILQVTDIDENQREIRDSINMTVFIKNPNIYALQAHKGYSEENVPGWKVPTNNGELNTMWRHDLRNIEGLAEDVAFTKYHQETRMEQTITGLPVGIYTIDLNAVNWDNKEDENAFCYVKTSETLPVGEGETEDRDLNFAATIDLQHWGEYVGNHDNLLQDIVVTDGVLTIGVNFGKGAQYEFDYAKLYLYAPVKDYNYNDVFNRVVTSIDENSKTAKVRALQLYDLNGRRIVTAQKGIQIVKKMMSDGTVKTQKVIK
ncbi:hypothetical protein SAMN04487901_11937 [Prevotella communis]|uniref:CBM-cenC domain-containing protein n=1 Tax=Prevotella communis TaxID=2913614 RepID=A0A1G8AFG3_9BACT|nr:hypothetical protein [Prevotella communis]SDH19678.1 hypothetical protein SAMN04487901_11937 [Prevotella communis]